MNIFKTIKKNIGKGLVASVLALGLLAGLTSTANATVAFIVQGGTQTSTAPQPGQFLIGNASNTYTLGYITGTGVVSVSTATGVPVISCPTCVTSTAATATGTAFNFPYFLSGGTGLAPTSSIVQSSSTGNIGIRDPIPGAALSLGTGDFAINSGRINFSNIETNNGLEYIFSPSGSGLLTVGARNNIQFLADNDANSNGGIDFETKNITRMFVSNNGNTSLGLSSTTTVFSPLQVGGTPAQTNTSTLVLLGSNFIIGGNVSGTVLGGNLPLGFNGDFENWQVNSSTIMKLTANGLLTINSQIAAVPLIDLQSGGTSYVKIGNSNTTTTPSGIISLYRGTTDAGDIQATGGNGLFISSPGLVTLAHSGFSTCSVNGVGIQCGPTNPSGAAADYDIGSTLSGAPSTGGIAIGFRGLTFNDTSTASSGTATAMNFNGIAQQTLTATNASVTTNNVAGFDFLGAPSAGTNETIGTSTAVQIDGANPGASTTNAYSLIVNAPTGGTNKTAALFVGSNPTVTLQGQIPALRFTSTQSGNQQFQIAAGFQNASSMSIVDVTNGNAQRLYISGNGNVGIGNVTPANKLDVSGTFGASGIATFGSSISTTIASAPFLGTNSSGIVIAVTTSTLKSFTDTFGYVTSTSGGVATTSINGTQAASFQIIGSGAITSTVSGATTTFSFINPGFLTNASVTAQSPLLWSTTSTLSCPTCLTSAPATTTINNFTSQSFAIQGDGISVTSTVNGSTTIFSTIGDQGEANYYFTNVASDVSSNKVASDTPVSVLASTTVAALSNGTTSLQQWATIANVPSLPFIPAGLFDVHIDAAQTAGTKPTFLYAVVNDITSTGTVVATILQTENGPVLTGTLTDYDLLGSLSDPYTMASTTDRIQVNVFASVSGALLAPTVQVYYGGSSADSRLELPASTADVTNFIPYVGAIKNVNLGSNSLSLSGTLSGGPATFVGNATTSNLTVTGVTNALHVAGSNGAVTAFTGSTTSGSGNCLTAVTISATGTLSNTNSTCSGGSGGGITTSSLGAYAVGNIGFFVNSSTESADNNFNWATSTQTLTFGGVTTINAGGNTTFNATGSLAFYESGVNFLVGASSFSELLGPNGTNNLTLSNSTGATLAASAIKLNSAVGTLVIQNNGGNTATLSVLGLTANRAINIPDNAGTLVLSTSSTVAGDCVKWTATSTIGDSGSACGSGAGTGTVTTSTAFTANSIPIINGNASIGNSTLSQPGGGITSVNNIPFLDGNADYIGSNIFMGVTSTAALGNVNQAGGVQAYNTTTTLTGEQFLAGGEVDILNTTGSITITIPSTSTIYTAAASAGIKIYSSGFSMQSMINDSTNTVFVAVTGTNEQQEFSPGTPTSLAPGQQYWITGQFVNSSTLLAASSSLTRLIITYTLAQTSTLASSLVYATSSGAYAGVTIGSGLSLSGGILTATGGGSASTTTVPTSWTVGASGASFTTIQAALDACGTAGGGQINIKPGTYAQGTTGLLWKGSNCKVYGSNGSTTITETGATTLWKTNSSSSAYSGDELHNLTMTGDSTTSSVGIDMSDMSHNIYDNIVMDSIAKPIVIHDTKDITFYNTFSNFNFTTVKSIGIDGSSTEPWNENNFGPGFIGCSFANCVGISDGNSQDNTFHDVAIEPSAAPLAGSIGILIFDSNVGTNPGNFGNQFNQIYMEGNASSVVEKVGASCGAGECIAGDSFNGGICNRDGGVTPCGNVIPTSTATSFNNFNNNFQVNTVLAGNLSITGVTSAPTVSAGGTLDPRANNNVGFITVTVGGVTTKTLTFSVAYPFLPVCQAQVSSGTGLTFVSKSTATNVLFTASAAIPTSTIVSYICIGNNSQN